MAKRLSKAQQDANKWLAENGDGESSPIPGPVYPYDLLEDDDTDWDREWIQAIDGRIAKWLPRLTTEWQSFPAGDPRYTKLDQDAINCLSLCGLIEQRLQCRATKAGCLERADFTCVVTGNYEAKWLKALAGEKPDWGDAEKILNDKTVEIRLTYEGEGAKADLLSGDKIKAAEVRIFTRGCTPYHRGVNPTEGTAVIEGEVKVHQPFSDEGQKTTRSSDWDKLGEVILKFLDEYGRWPKGKVDNGAVKSDYNKHWTGSGKPWPKCESLKTVSEKVRYLKKQHGG